jgi:hypothetical protein
MDDQRHGVLIGVVPTSRSVAMGVPTAQRQDIAAPGGSIPAQRGGNRRSVWDSELVHKFAHSSTKFSIHLLTTFRANELCYFKTNEARTLHY